MRRFMLWAPIVLVFVVASTIFLAARAPRTWAAHWSTPRSIASGASQNEYGAVYGKHGWDILWYDDAHQALLLTRHAGGGSSSLVLDRGDITQPTLLREKNQEVAAWVHNHNGSTDLMAADIGSRRPARPFRLIAGVWPVEHPYLFAGPSGAVDLVFSWQRYGNFDVFLASLQPGAARPSFIRRLTRAPIYAFYPRAVLDPRGRIDLLYLDACCQARAWHVVLNQYDGSGRRLPGGTTLQTVANPGGTNSTPTQWAQDIGVDPSGDVVGAYASNPGIRVFQDLSGGRVRTLSLDPLPGIPNSLALVLGPRTDDLLWEQPFDLGTYLASQHFGSRLTDPGSPERAVYEAAAQTGIHAVRRGESVHVLWQAMTPSLRSTFQTALSSVTRQPDLAQRFGLGLGNPFEALAVLIVVAAGIAVITTMGNILTIIGYGVAGLLVMRVLREARGRWVLFVVVLAASLCLTFVSPGGPVLFLATLPTMGFRAVPFGIVAGAAVLLLLLWLGAVIFARVEDLFRIALLVVAGVYFFAFLEAIVFVQQRLGYI